MTCFECGTAVVPLCVGCHGKIHGHDRLWTGNLTKAGLQHKKSLGFKLGAPALEDAATLARVQELRAQGLSFQEVADVLTREGFKTLRGGGWHPSTVLRLLRRAKAKLFRTLDGFWETRIPGYSEHYRLLHADWNQALAWLWAKLDEIEQRGWVEFQGEDRT